MHFCIGSRTDVKFLSPGAASQHISGTSGSSVRGVATLSPAVARKFGKSGASGFPCRSVISLSQSAAMQLGIYGASGVSVIRETSLSSGAAMQLGIHGASEMSSRGMMQLGTCNASGSSVASGAHQKIRGTKAKYILCGYCDTKLIHKDEEEQHWKVLHKQQKPYLCTKCGQRFQFREELDWHATVTCTGKESE